MRARCAAHGLAWVAIGAGPQEGIPYAAAAGARILRTSVPGEPSRRWVDEAAAVGIMLVVHPHIGIRGSPGALATREDLLRYLDERPGMQACPDTGHLALCGFDAVQTIRDLGERCRYLHLSLQLRLGHTLSDSISATAPEDGSRQIAPPALDMHNNCTTVFT